MDRKDSDFKKRFLALVKKFPCTLGYHLSDQISEYSFNHRPVQKATHKTIEGMVKAIKRFKKEHRSFKLKAADDPWGLLFGFVVYDVLPNGKEIAKWFTLPLSIVIKNPSFNENIKKMFLSHWEE